MKSSPVVHFEMPQKDRERVKKFYEQAFGWKMHVFGPEMGGYVLATTTPTDEKTNRPTEPGSINGGFFEYSSENPRLQYPSIVIAVDDIHAAMKSVTDAGGKVLGGQKDGEVDAITGIGLYIAIEDTEGNRVGILQPAAM